MFVLETSNTQRKFGIKRAWQEHKGMSLWLEDNLLSGKLSHFGALLPWLTKTRKAELASQIPVSVKPRFTLVPL